MSDVRMEAIRMHVKNGSCLLPGEAKYLLEQLDSHRPNRDDDVAGWLKRQRDKYRRMGEVLESQIHLAIDDLLDDYRLHADTGTPLSEEALDGSDSECNGAYV